MPEKVWHDEQYNTGLSFDYSNVATFMPPRKPETRQEKYEFINNFEHRGGRNYYPRASSYALNVKLYGAVQIPQEFLKVVDNEWFYLEWNDFHVDDIRSIFEEENSSYTFRFGGRSGGYMRLLYNDGKDRTRAVEQPEYDEDSTRYEEVMAQFHHWQEVQERHRNMKWLNEHKRKLQLIVQDVAGAHNLAHKPSQLHHTSFDRTIRLIQSGVFASDFTLVFHPTQVFKMFYSTRDVMYDDLPEIGKELGYRILDECRSSNNAANEAGTALKASYHKKYGRGSTSKPKAIETWDDKELDELVNILWKFCETAQSLAIDFAYMCFDQTCQAKAGNEETED